MFEKVGDCMEYGTYTTSPEKNGKGTFFYTDCGHQMYSVNGKMSYHGCYCPACFWKGVDRILYIRGSKEANEHIKK